LPERVEPREGIEDTRSSISDDESSGSGVETDGETDDDHEDYVETGDETDDDHEDYAKFDISDENYEYCVPLPNSDIYYPIGRGRNSLDGLEPDFDDPDMSENRFGGRLETDHSDQQYDLQDAEDFDSNEECETREFNNGVQEFEEYEEEEYEEEYEEESEDEYEDEFEDEVENEVEDDVEDDDVDDKEEYEENLP
jgi:hypothetical protein